MGFSRLRYAMVGVTLLALVLGVAATGAARSGKDAPSGGAGERRVVERVLHRMSLEEKVGQMFVTYAYGDSVEDTDPEMVAANREAHGVDNFRQLIERYHLGGIIYFAWSGNVENPHQIAGLSNGIQRAALGSGAGVPMLISTDQEQGVVVRVDEPATQFPGSMALGAGRSTDDAYTAAAITGEELRAIGINQNFAPVADVNVNTRNPVIGVRSFGSDPDLVSGMTVAQVNGYQRQNVAATAKHFPGHGDTDVDSHTGLPVINHSREELEEIDLPPFQAAIDEGVDSVMTAHIVVPALDDSGRPATLSRPILTGLLRREMGFDGVIVTDSLGMAGVRQQFGDERVPVEAIKAGADMLLMPPDLDLAYNAVLDAVKSGEIKKHRIDESVRRILILKLRRGLFQNPYVDESKVDEVVGIEEHHAAADAISNRTVTLIKNDASLLPLRQNTGAKVLITGAGGYPGSPADGAERSTLNSFATAMEEFGVETEVYETGTNPDASRRSTAVAKAQNSDLVVVTTNKAWTSGNQQQLVKDLLATGRPVIVAGIRDPYDIAYFTEAQTYLATYSYKPVSMEALARVLFGAVDPTGKLPVTIPTADDPNAVLYPYGHGLSY
ncbi:Beta-hexosaminidase [Rubrobacter xylanophilus DSM 9941]|uniref:glycoside hydrolase family 3 protein n=1 Tax=Rubrobacter xylanophilus TaxID=49319 RepID=UPI001C63CDF5|nr:glycoside hydrolase family 3 protein [Rubrobacter xylanophilus]QYJ16829.1 Beta-hexosaminidase [Rubrobacter xylanophilus DSM 9941]